MSTRNETERRIGIVKWFGGNATKIDRFTGRELPRRNDYGFIETISGTDIYINQREIQTGDSLDEGDLVFFAIGQRQEKLFARNLYALKPGSRFTLDALNSYLSSLDVDSSHNPVKKRSIHAAIGNALAHLIDDSLETSTDELFKAIADIASKDAAAIDFIANHTKYKKHFSSKIPDDAFKGLLENDFPLEFADQQYLLKNRNILYAHISDKPEHDRVIFFSRYANTLPVVILTGSILKKLITSFEQVASRKNDIDKHIRSVSSGKSGETVQKEIESIAVEGCELTDAFKYYFGRLLEQLVFKDLLYTKNPRIKEFYEGSTYLKGEIEYFVLANLFSLVQANSDIDSVAKVFFSIFIEAVMSKDIDINGEELFKLFPQCGTRTLFHKRLSCEAVYWPKNENYLCRGAVCENPQVKPDLGKHYTDYNIYEWFSHYGVRYLEEQKSSKRDFPIKLAGYINRLKEIFSRLHCRKCENLMQPNLRYSRVEYSAYEDGKIVKKNMASAYRVTVFHCGTEGCEEFGRDYYINHCVGFGCYAIIDSRDLSTKCGNGLYICANCGSCCEFHGKSNPVGLCPQCGDSLELCVDTSERDRYDNPTKFVRCVNQSCNFKITGELPKKFMLAAVGSAKKVRL
jgi:cold shock CspA family protein